MKRSLALVAVLLLVSGQKKTGEDLKLQEEQRQLSLSLAKTATSTGLPAFETKTYLDVPDGLKLGRLRLVSPEKQNAYLLENELVISIAIGEKDGHRVYVLARPEKGWWPRGSTTPPSELDLLRKAIVGADPRIKQCGAGRCNNYCQKAGVWQCCDAGC